MEKGDNTSKGMTYLKAVEELEAYRPLGDDPAMPRIKLNLESCARGMDFIFRMGKYEEADYQNASSLLGIMPELRERRDRAEYLKSYASSLEQALKGQEPENKTELIDFLTELGSRYIHTDIARTLGPCGY